MKFYENNEEYVYDCQTCVCRQMYENEKLIDHLLSAATSHMDVSQYVGPPCSHNPCLNEGVCVPQLNEYVCRCGRGFQGQNCEQGEAYISGRILLAMTCAVCA